MLRLILSLILCIFFSINAYAETSSIDVSINDESAQIAAKVAVIENVYGYIAVNGRFLYTDDNQLGSIGGDIFGNIDLIKGLLICVGGKFYAVRADTDNLYAIGMGGGAIYKPPFFDILELSMNFYYAPEVVSFNEAEKMFETSFKAGLYFIPPAMLHIGYYNIRADIDLRDRETISEGVRVGLEFKF